MGDRTGGRAARRGGSELTPAPARFSAVALLPSAASLLAGLLSLALAEAPPLIAGGLTLAGLISGGLVLRYPARAAVWQAALLGLWAAFFGLSSTPRPSWWLAPALGTALVLLYQLAEANRRGSAVEKERDDLALQLDRRINELFSLQELGYVLARSLQLEQIASQVVSYVRRFLQAEGAVLALLTEDGERLVVSAAEGSLAELAGRTIPEEEGTLVMQAIMRERIEVGQSESGNRLQLLGGVAVNSAVAAPLRAHGLTMGILAVADRRSGGFTTEDLWLISTVSTHVAVVLANSRLFEIIRQAKEEWETAFNALGEGIAVVDSAGRVRRANKALSRLLDVPQPTVIGREFWETVIGPRDAAAGLLEAIQRGERHSPVVLRSEALHRVLRLTAAPLAEPGEGAAVVVLIEDVTEQKALETRLIQHEKLAAVGQLVSGVAHELNNPLTSIAGLSEFLQERAPPQSPDREHLRVIREQADRAGRIVRSLLTFARKETAETSRLDLNDVVLRTLALMAYELRFRGIDLQQRLTPGPAPVKGDRHELQQVLLNLLTNAAQALSETREGAPRRITVETLREGTQALLRVADTGPGVALQHVPHLFTPFFTTKEPGHGTGLGLSISYGIVESHGGTLSYAPGPQGGSEFTVSLPLEEPAAESPGEPGPGEETTSCRSILVVDDDPGVVRLVSALFAQDGHRVEGARNGAHALQLLREKSYDLIIADERTAAGAERPLLEAIAAEYPAAAARMVLSSNERNPSRLSALQAGGHRVLTKPLNLRDLRRAAGEVWAAGR